METKTEQPHIQRSTYKPFPQHAPPQKQNRLSSKQPNLKNERKQKRQKTQQLSGEQQKSQQNQIDGQSKPISDNIWKCSTYHTEHVAGSDHCGENGNLTGVSDSFMITNKILGRFMEMARSKAKKVNKDKEKEKSQYVNQKQQQNQPAVVSFSQNPTKSSKNITITNNKNTNKYNANCLTKYNNKSNQNFQLRSYINMRAQSRGEGRKGNGVGANFHSLVGNAGSNKQNNDKNHVNYDNPNNRHSNINFLQKKLQKLDLDSSNIQIFSQTLTNSNNLLLQPPCPQVHPKNPSYLRPSSYQKKPHSKPTTLLNQSRSKNQLSSLSPTYINTINNNHHNSQLYYQISIQIGYIFRHLQVLKGYGFTQKKITKWMNIFLATKSQNLRDIFLKSYLNKKSLNNSMIYQRWTLPQSSLNKTSALLSHLTQTQTSFLLSQIKSFKMYIQQIVLKKAQSNLDQIFNFNFNIPVNPIIKLNIGKQYGISNQIFHFMKDLKSIEDRYGELGSISKVNRVMLKQILEAQGRFVGEFFKKGEEE